MSTEDKYKTDKTISADDENSINKDLNEFRQSGELISNFRELINFIFKYSEQFTFVSEEKRNIAASFHVYESLLEHLLHPLLTDDQKRF